MQLVPANASR